MCCILCLVTQLCPTLCNLMDYNLPGYSVHGKNTGVDCHTLTVYVLDCLFKNVRLVSLGDRGSVSFRTEGSHAYYPVWKSQVP